MQIEATWSIPLDLAKSAQKHMIYDLDLEQIPTSAGVYVFGRKHGGKVTPIYIGESLNLRSRISGHLKSLPLMRAIETAPSGARFLIFCTVKAGTAAKSKKHVRVIEKALILHAQGEGHTLVNKKGTLLPTDEIRFKGNRTSEALAPRLMLIKKALT